jgi:hypothetical protein
MRSKKDSIKFYYIDRDILKLKYKRGRASSACAVSVNSELRNLENFINFDMTDIYLPNWTADYCFANPLNAVKYSLYMFRRLNIKPNPKSNLYDWYSSYRKEGKIKLRKLYDTYLLKT